MATPIDESLPTSSYPMDAENMAEMARLIKQARLVSEHLDLFPLLNELSQRQTILDIGCGPGEWVLNMARHFPDSQVRGIDISRIMIKYAQDSAQTQQIANAHFQIMDAHQPLEFPDVSFDVVHARFVGSFLSPTSWPVFLQECFRVTQPGGLFCNTEFENMGINTSPSLTHFNILIIQAARKAGQCFTTEGDQFGITAVHARLLQDAGFQQIQQQAYVLNYSAGTPAHAIMYDNWRTALRLIQPFLLRQEVATQEEIDTLYERAMQEMQADTFCAVILYQTTWGQKPPTA